MQTFILAAFAVVTLYAVLAVILITRRGEPTKRAAMPVPVRVKERR